jgi:hypothetical protein
LRRQVQYCTSGLQEITDFATVSFRWIIHFWYFCFILAYKASLALYSKIKQKYQKWIIHWKLIVATSEREGKLSNRARCMEKFTKIYGNPRASAARAPCGDFLPPRGTVHQISFESVDLLNLLSSRCMSRCMSRWKVLFSFYFLRHRLGCK